jgi:tryptophanyl-tRNA synthetase
VEVKTRLARALNARLEPMRQRRAEVLAKPGWVRDLLFEHSARARAQAAATLARVREAMKIAYR